MEATARPRYVTDGLLFIGLALANKVSVLKGELLMRRQLLDVLLQLLFALEALKHVLTSLPCLNKPIPDNEIVQLCQKAYYPVCIMRYSNNLRKHQISAKNIN